MSRAVLVVRLYPVDFARCAALLYAIWRSFGDRSILLRLSLLVVKRQLGLHLAGPGCLLVGEGAGAGPSSLALTAVAEYQAFYWAVL